MKRETSPLATLLFLLVTLPLVFAQDPQTQPGPALPSDILGPQLIAWSQLQKPQPVPQPLPQEQQPAAPTFMGTIIKDGARYVLKVSNNSAYQLDDQDRAKPYEGKQVRIAGTLNADGQSLHITSIELIS
jgi:hypothetical protein